MCILTISLITVVDTPILPSFPTRRSSDLGQHPPVLLAGFEPLLRSFLVIDVGAGANTFEDRALDRKITGLNSSHLGISYAVFSLKTLFRFKWGACVYRRQPRVQCALSVIG